MNRTNSKVVLLLGGGIDSTALISYYFSHKVSIQGIHFDYGQPSLTGERRSIFLISQHYGIPIHTVKLGWSIPDTQGEYHCRNALLVIAAASTFNIRQGIIAIGIHKGTPYYDCSPSFIKDSQKILDGYLGGAIQVEAPFIELSKREIFDFCLAKKVPLKITFSCERRGDRPCGECPSCQDRKVLDEHYQSM